MSRYFLPFVVFGLSGPLAAQITLWASPPEPVTELRSLASGTKLLGGIDPNTGTRTVYNMDLTVYRTLNFAPAPAGYEWFRMDYITETLFDTDSTTIEYLMHMRDTLLTLNMGVAVLREDGTILFQAIPGQLLNSLGDHLSGGADAIFSANGQAFMILHTQNADPSLAQQIYLLPGQLPCLDCQGSPVSAFALGTEERTTGAGGLAIRPNPTADRCTVELVGLQADLLQIWTASGQLVGVRPMNTTVEVLDTSSLAPGLYQLVALKDGVRVANTPMVVR